MLTASPLPLEAKSSVRKEERSVVLIYFTMGRPLKKAMGRQPQVFSEMVSHGELLISCA